MNQEVLAARDLIWLCDTRDRVREFPEGVRTEVGFALYLAQNGMNAGSVKLLRHFGAPVWQIRADDGSGTFRVVYVTHLKSAVYVLHAFQKKSTRGIATAQRDIDLIRARLRLANELSAGGGDHE